MESMRTARLTSGTISIFQQSDGMLLFLAGNIHLGNIHAVDGEWRCGRPGVAGVLGIGRR
jgi:hypothetical protein